MGSISLEESFGNDVSAWRALGVKIKANVPSQFPIPQDARAASAHPIQILQIMLRDMPATRKNRAIAQMTATLMANPTLEFRKLAELARDLLTIERLSLSDDVKVWMQPDISVASLKNKIALIPDIPKQRRSALTITNDITFEKLCDRMEEHEEALLSRRKHSRKPSEQQGRKRAWSSTSEEKEKPEKLEKETSALQMNVITQQQPFGQRKNGQGLAQARQPQYQQPQYQQQRGGRGNRNAAQQLVYDQRSAFLDLQCTFKNCSDLNQHLIRKCPTTFPKGLSKAAVEAFFEEREKRRLERLNNRFRGGAKRQRYSKNRSYKDRNEDSNRNQGDKEGGRTPTTAKHTNATRPDNQQRAK